jgi:predicted nucleic acid-binding protein
MNDIKSVLLDTSFCIRLTTQSDEFHKNVVGYYEYFLEKNIDMYLSTIALSEYSLLDNPDILKDMGIFRIINFDYSDAKIAGSYFRYLYKSEGLSQFGARRVVINDLKLFAQVHNREIDAYITKDKKSYSKMAQPLMKDNMIEFEFVDLAIPVNERLGKLF